MKKLFFCLFIIGVCFPFSLIAQVGVGLNSIGGNISYGSATYKDLGYTSKSSAFSISPSYGRFLTDNIYVGGTLSSSFGKVNIDSDPNKIYRQK
jgi:hypothetical protein